MNLKNLFLEAPESQLDPLLKPIVERWDDPPTPLQILEVLDIAVNTGGGSSFAVTVLSLQYERSLKENNTTHEEVVKQATWR